MSSDLETRVAVLEYQLSRVLAALAKLAPQQQMDDDQEAPYLDISATKLAFMGNFWALGSGRKVEAAGEVELPKTERVE